jgi:hypothetical protein
MPQRSVEVILARGREVERQLAKTDAGPAESESLQAEALRLRDAYDQYPDAFRARNRQSQKGRSPRLVGPWGSRACTG